MSWIECRCVMSCHVMLYGACCMSLPPPPSVWHPGPAAGSRLGHAKTGTCSFVSLKVGGQPARETCKRTPLDSVQECGGLLLECLS